jgi:hypothetical protein
LARCFLIASPDRVSPTRERAGRRDGAFEQAIEMMGGISFAGGLRLRFDHGRRWSVITTSPPSRLNLIALSIRFVHLLERVGSPPVRRDEIFQFDFSGCGAADKLLMTSSNRLLSGTVSMQLHISGFGALNGDVSLADACGSRFLE